MTTAETTTLIKVECVDQVLRLTQTPTIASGGVKEDTVEFAFDSLWDGFALTAVFYRNENEVYHVEIVDNRCIVPKEVLANPGYFYLGVMGVKDGVTRTTNVLSYRVEAGAITVGVQPPEPTPSIYEQILASVKSAEQIAQSVRYDADAGKFDGSKGDKGDKGDPGAPGKDGSDATVTAENIRNALGYAPVQDVQVNGKSVLTNSTANVPIASDNSLGVVRGRKGIIQVGGDGTMYPMSAMHYDIDNRRATNDYAVDVNNRSLISPARIDYAVKAAMCDGKGAEWASTERRAARDRIGLDVPYELIEEITISEENVAVIARDVDELTEVYVTIICPPQTENTTTNALVYFGNSQNETLIYVFAPISPLNDKTYRHTTVRVISERGYWRAYRTTEADSSTIYPNGSWMTGIAESAPSRLLQNSTTTVSAITKMFLYGYPSPNSFPVGTKISIYGVKA
ncbi:MAG: hypothetical protein Q4E18_02745 [Clostridia bacterium]|nr:hypothetical protein [Clostridia bacterium]